MKKKEKKRDQKRIKYRIITIGRYFYRLTSNICIVFRTEYAFCIENEAPSIKSRKVKRKGQRK